MIEFQFHRPQSLREALELLVELGSSARVLAGGTDLMIYLRSRRGLAGVKHVVDITGLGDRKSVV